MVPFSVFMRKRHRRPLFLVNHTVCTPQWAIIFSQLARCCGSWRLTLCDRIAGTILGATFYLPCSDELLCTRTIIRRMLFPERRRLSLLIGETWELLKRTTRRTWISAGSYLPSIFITGAGLYERPAILTRVRNSALIRRVVQLKPWARSFRVDVFSREASFVAQYSGEVSRFAAGRLSKTLSFSTIASSGGNAR